MAARKKESNDNLILKLKEEIKSRRKEIAETECNLPNRTNMTFSFSEKISDSVNLNAISSVEALIKMHSTLKSMKDSYEESAKILNVESIPKFTWMGYEFCHWEHDIKNKISKIQLTEKKNKLNQLEEKLNQLMSTELKTQLTLEEISGQLLS